MDPQSLALLEKQCVQLYNSPDQLIRQEAEKALLPYFEQADYIPQCQHLLDHSQEPFALLFAATALKKVITKHWNYFTEQQRVDVRNYMLAFLANRGPSLTMFVRDAVVRLICRITKIGWFEDSRHREITDHVKQFLQASTEHCIIGLQILNNIIEEMNSKHPGSTITKHRRVAISFRDKALFTVFQMGLTMLRQLLQQPSMVVNGQQDERLKEQTLGLVINCMSFDFLGTSPDESTEEVGAIQAPSSWRSVFEEPATLQFFFDLHSKSTAHHAGKALECLVLFASVRRSIFTNEVERAKFLASVMRNVGTILRTKHCLDDPNNHHQLCRLLARLKSNFQLTELVNSDDYTEWITLVTDFTVTTFCAWQWAPNSIHMLLLFWGRLVASIPYLKGETLSKLEEYAPRVVSGYVASRLEMVRALAQGEVTDDPMEEPDTIAEEMEPLFTIGRCSYRTTAQNLLAYLDPIAKQYQMTLLTQDPSIWVAERQLVWLIHVISAVIGGRMSSGVKESDDEVDGEVASRVFQLMLLAEQRVAGIGPSPNSGTEQLEIAFLYFVQQFKKVYLGDSSSQWSSKVYGRLGDIVQLGEHTKVLGVFVNKIASNLKTWAQSTVIVDRTLSLLQEMSSSYSASKLLLKNDAINFILAHHTAQDNFAFLDVVAHSRRRTLYYKILARLIFNESCQVPLEQFMAPFDLRLTELGQGLQLRSDHELRSDSVKRLFIGLCRDLQGIVTSCHRKPPYILLFDWLYPTHFPVLTRMAEVFYDDHEVISPLLKFLAEFVQDRSQRLQFDASSPNGILLFRECSRIICAYGTRALSRQLPLNCEPYQELYKGAWLCLSVLSRLMGGSYINFGVFRLYEDPAFSDALSVCLKLAFCVPLDLLPTYPKFFQEAVTFLQHLTENHTDILIEGDSETLARTLTTLNAGVKSMQSSISFTACTAIDSIASWIFSHSHPTRLGMNKQTESENAVRAVVQRHEAAHPSLFPDVQASLLNMLIFDDMPFQWCASRSLFTLILTHETAFKELQQQIALTQPPANRQRVLDAFGKLMKEVKPNLESRNRDRFTQNMTVFRSEIRNLMV